MNLEQLRARLAELVAQAQTIRDTAAGAQRDLNGEESERLDAILDEFDEVEAQIQRLERIEAAANRSAAPQPRQVAAQREPQAEPEPARQTARVPREAANPAERNRWGWQNFGDFCRAVRAASANPGNGMDPRLTQAASLSTYGSEGSGADGGFAVPPEWRATIMQMVEGEESLLPRTDQQQAGGNTITYPTDETTPWQTTGGIQAYWDGEVSTISQSKPSLKPMTVRLNRLTCLIPVTDELLEDAPAMSSYVQRKAAEKMAFKVTDAIVNGDGAGMPLGFMSSGALVTVSKESSQVADTIVAENIAKMWARMYGPSRKNAIWLINQDVEPQLAQLNVKVKNVAGTENVGGLPVYIPAGGFSAAPYATLYGRPVITSESMAAIGDLGDIALADFSKYLSVVKTGGLRSDVSMHLWFDQATTAFRFIFRMAGQPWLSTAIARKNGSNTLSHFVTLEAR